MDNLGYAVYTVVYGNGRLFGVRALNMPICGAVSDTYRAAVSAVRAYESAIPARVSALPFGKLILIRKDFYFV